MNPSLLIRSVVLATLALAGPVSVAGQAPAALIESSTSIDDLGSRSAQLSRSPNGALALVDPFRGEFRFVSSSGVRSPLVSGRGRVLGWLGDTAVITTRGDRLVLFTPDGTLQRIVPLSQRASPDDIIAPYLRSPAPLRLYGGDRLAFTARIVTPPPSQLDRTVHGVNAVVWWQAANGSQRGPYIRIPSPTCLAQSVVPSDAGRAFGVPYCSPELALAALPGERLAVLSNDQAAADRAAFSVIILDRMGDTVVAASFPRPAWPVTDSMWDAALRSPLFERSAKMLADVRRPLTLPVADHLIGTDSGGVWIGLHSDDSAQEWWYIDAHGTRGAVMSLPRHAEVIAATADRLVTVVTDSTTRQIVTWRAPT